MKRNIPNPQGGSHHHGMQTRLHAWMDHHQDSLRDALRRLARRPLGQILSMLVIGLSLSLPMTLLLTLHSARVGLNGWSQEMDIIQVFLQATPQTERAEQWVAELKNDPRLRDVRIITPDQGLKQLAQLHQFDSLLAEVKDNPLPVVIEVYPRQKESLEALRAELAARPGVASARMDAEAVERLHRLMASAEHLLLIFLLMLAPTLAITVSNTIRLELEHRIQEVRLLQLIGATSAFIRRPLLYVGGLLGAGGALLAVIINVFALHAVVEAMSGAGFTLSVTATPLLVSLLLLPVGFVFGLLAAWLASVVQMRAIRVV